MKSSINLLIFLIMIIGLMQCSHSYRTAHQRPEEETIDVGYGKAKKTDITGSVYHEKTRESDTNNPNKLIDILRRSPGVLVTGSAGNYHVQIRGLSTITSSSEPLIVLDGSPIGGDINSVIGAISPNNIAGVTILKDASAASIYGSRGANGVILINLTKAGN